VKTFKSPRKSLGSLDAETTAGLIAAAADVALVVDRKGVIKDVAFGSDELSRELDVQWTGQSWIETVTTESRPKIDSLLQDAADGGGLRWRQLNHASSRGASVPVMYSAIRLGDDGRVLALGRDLRAVATLQQRLIAAEQSIERDYSRLRHAEMRYRLLFQVSTEPVLIVDASTQRVVDSNPAAAQLLGEGSKRLVGRAFPDGFDPAGTRAINTLLSTVRATGRAEDLRARLADGEREFLVSASLFRQDNASHFLVRLSPVHVEAGALAMPRAKSRLLEVIEGLPDGIVVTGIDGRILTANRAFLDLAQLATEEQARNQSLERWLGRPGVDLGVLIANLKQHGSVRLFSTTLRGEYGSTAEVEISAVSVPESGEPCFGFTMRNVGRRLAVDARVARELPRSVEQLTELVGRVSLKDLVRETTDVIERLCIEAALELTRDNRASAAEMLGLSRQSLYVKLRRYGLGDLDGDGDDDAPAGGKPARTESR
jgi:transcriptional regulator PpsR